MKTSLIKKIIIAILSALAGVLGGASMCVAFCAVVPL